MIISASRRTDIPARYTPWLVNRLRAGFALVRSPMAPRRVSRVSLDPGAVDGIVFWTKDPRPLMEKLDALRDYMYYFQFTLTPYGPDVEPGLPDKGSVLVPAFQALAERLGPRRVVWRYDPILLTRAYDRDFHLRAFQRMAEALAPYTSTCVVSFLDYYRCMGRGAARLGVEWPPPAWQEGLAKELAGIAQGLGLTMAACAESLDLGRWGIAPARCVDGQLLESLLGRPLAAGKDKNQRPDCGCASSVDIGAYSSCPHGCVYCYANHGAAAVARSLAAHDPASPLLTGALGPEDRVTERRGEGQLRFGI